MGDFLAKNVIRIVGGVIIVGAVTVLTNSMLPVASHHAALTAAKCAVSATAVGGALTVSGSGFAPSTQYLLFLSSPGGNGETTTSSDAAGYINYGSTAYWKGTYGATLWTSGHNSALAASCTSATVS
jgi:hypothetical protein